MEESSLTQSFHRPSFSSLIGMCVFTASRTGRKRKLPSERELQDAAINLITHNQDISALLLETTSGCGSTTLSCEVSSAGTDGMWKHDGQIRLIESELCRQAETLCVPVSLLSVRMVVETLVSLHGSPHSTMIDSAHRVKLMTLLRSARELLNVGAFSPKLFWQEYWKTQPVLEVLYRLHTEDLLPLEHTLNSAGVAVWLVSQFQSLCGSALMEEDEELRHHMLSTVVCVLVRAGFEDNQDSCVSQTCCLVLDTMLTWLLDSLEETHPTPTGEQPPQPVPAAAVWLGVFDVALYAASVSEDAVRKFFTHTLTRILTHHPRLKVSEAVEMQSQWSFAKTSRSLASLYCKVCVMFRMEEVCSHLQQVLETLEVNWQHVLSCISTLLVYHSHTQSCLKELLSRLLSSAFHSYDVEKMITALLLARQGALEGPAVFPSYSEWFKMSFGGASGYHGNSKKSLVFLLKFLSDLVPFDPPQYLKVHVMHPPYVPVKHRSLLQEFVSLCRTRLSDLKVSVEQMGLYEVVSGAVTEVQPECVAQQDVEKAVALFESTGRISATVMEASIFRRPYFLSRFLSALLTPRMLPEQPDARMAFIESLRKAEKIPAALYYSYTEGCMREQHRAGVSSTQVQAPQVGVQSELQELKRLLSTEASEGEIRGQLAVLSQTLSSACDRQDSQRECDIINLSLDPPTSSYSTPSVVNVILQGFCECVVAACRVAPPNRQCQWVGVFLKMLSGHTQLYTHILHRVVQLLHIQGPSLSAPHVLALAVLVVEQHVCRDQLPLVDLHLAHTHSTRLSPSEALSGALPLSTAPSMHFSLRFSVAAVCYAVCRSSSNRKELTHFVPHHLYKQLLFLMTRLVPEVRADVSAVAVRGSVCSEDENADEEQCVSAWSSVTVSERSVWSSVKALWMNTSIRNLQTHQQHQLSFTEWLMMELQVQRSHDALSDTDRQVYERWACQQWFLPLCERAGGCGGNAETASTHIINTVLNTRLASAPPRTDSCSVDLLSRLQEVLWEVQYTRRRTVKEEEKHFFWDLIHQRCSIVSEPGNISTDLELQRILHICNSIILAVPSPLLVNVRCAGGRSALRCEALMEHINTHQRRGCVPAGVLSCSLTTHFLSAVLSASVNCESPLEAVDVTQISHECPLLLLSTVRWWGCISTVVTSLWERLIGGEQPALIHLLTECNDWVYSSVRGVSARVPEAPALMLAVCLHSALEQQGGATQLSKAKRALTAQKQTEVLVFLLFFYISDLISAYLTAQADLGVNRATDLSVHLITLLMDSSDWLSLFHQSGCVTEERSSYQPIVSMVTTDVNMRLMPFAFFSVLAAVDECVLNRVMVTSGFLLTAVMSYISLMKLFLHTHTAEIRSNTLQQTLCRAQQIVLRSISVSPSNSITHNQLHQMEEACRDVDPEVAASLSTLMNLDDL
ncbi:Fanconi anemia group A protein-like isoform X2 [Trichomycterus rosablanca]|uniref:Fanconi anemia group A protein-like isoform X2 n=1 Tax=Trichomycterus rosablanca TaxID=2290929 RepID=UPI002F3583AA